MKPHTMIAGQLLFLAMLGAGGHAAAQKKKPLQLDLSGAPYYEQSIRTGSIDSLQLVNRLPSDSAVYTVTVIKTRVASPGLSMPTAATKKEVEKEEAKMRELIKSQKSDTRAIEAAIQALSDERVEANIREHIVRLEALIEKAGSASSFADQVRRAKALIKKTSEVRALSQSMVMDNDETLSVRVTRVLKNSNEKAEWEFVFHTPPVRLKVFYGFTYSPNVIDSENTFFAAADEDSTTYTLTKGRNDDGKSVYKNLTPTVMFTYYFTRKVSDFRVAAAGGVSLDLENLSAMIGPSVVIGDVLSINSGIVFREKHRLLSHYSEGQTLKESLTFDQLHEEVWRPELYFSIGFRFSSNPFTKK